MKRTLAAYLLVLLACTAFSQGLVQAEYFWDTDPGSGNGTAVSAADSAFDQTVEALIHSTVGLPATLGTHKFSLRVKDNNNNWGPAFSVIINMETSSVPARNIKVISAEYFFNNDPGAGNAFPMLAFDGNFNNALEAILQSNIGLPASGVGTHTFNVRVKAADGVWGPIFTTVIRVELSQVTSRAIKVTAGECYFNVDPGAGNATPLLAFDGNFNTAIEQLTGGTLPIPVDSGWNTLYVRVRDAENVWGPSFGVVVFVDTTTGAFSTYINGNVTICNNEPLTNLTYSTGNSSGCTYAWSVTGGTINSGNGTNSVNVSWISPPYFIQLIECDTSGSYCDTAALSIDILPVYSLSVNKSICAGDSLFVGGAFQNSGGIYVDTFQSATGCDSVVTTTLTELPIDTVSHSVTICSGQNYVAGGAQQTTPGLYYDTYQNASGCDSIVETNLSVTPAITSSMNVSICDGDSYFAGGASQTLAGIYLDTLTTTNGCDSILTTNLSLLLIQSTTLNSSIYSGDSIFAGGNWQYADGIYVDSFLSAQGCDSFVITNLTVETEISVSQDISICDGESYFAGGALQTSAGVYHDTFIANGGCDSIITLHYRC